MLIGLGCWPEPGVVRQIDHPLHAFRGHFSEESRDNVFVADRDPQTRSIA